MSRAYCECPRCRRSFPVTWDWEPVETDYLRDDDGEVVSDCDLLDATRVTYLHHVACPDCGTRLRIWHELVPRFYASKETSDGTD